MAKTIIGQPAEQIPLWVGRAVVDLRQTWAGEWELHPELQVESMEVHSAVSGLSSVRFRVRYGDDVKYPWEGSFKVVESDFLNDWWVRVRLVGEDTSPDDGGFEAQFIPFVGRITAETRTLFSAPDESSGRQDWVAYGPMRILQRIPITRSHWLDKGFGRVIDWVPDFNARDARRQLVGNRSSEKFSGAYVFDPSNRTPTFPNSNLWSRYDVLEYIIARFVDVSAEDGPEWTVTGEALEALRGEITRTPIIDDMGNLGLKVVDDNDLSADVFRMAANQSAFEVIRQVVNPTVGVDFLVRPTETGFELHVFALSPEEDTAAGDVTFPRNSDLVEITSGTAIDMIRNTVIQTAERRYSAVRIIGRRVVTCCTLRGAKATTGEATSVPGWSPALELEYEAGTGTPSDPASDHDAVRKSDRYSSVYGMFRAPDDWDLNGYTAAFQADGDGQLSLFIDTAKVQRTIRSTLTWTPIEQGVDYLIDPPGRSNQPLNPEFLPPLVYLRNQQERLLFGKAVWINAEELGINVSVLRNDWGVFLSHSPNHLIGGAQFDASNAPTDTPAVWDYEDMVITLAFQLDSRFELRYRAGNPNEEVRKDDELVIDAPDAELWFLAQNTVVGLDRGRQLIERPTGVLVRDDTPRLRLTMAGARARHLTERGRAAVTFNGTLAASGLLGQILTVVASGGDTHQIQSPITSATWSFGNEPTTAFQAGFA